MVKNRAAADTGRQCGPTTKELEITRFTGNHAGIPAPADAVKLTEWERIFSLHELHRWFYGTSRDIGCGVSVAIGGYQNSDGSIRERIAYLSVDKKGGVLDAAALRALARAAASAADELDELSDDVGTVNDR
jgi:hypothetical protein